MAEHDAATAHATDHDDHGHHGPDPAEDNRAVGLILVLLGLGLALGIGRHVPGTAGEQTPLTSFEGIVTLDDGRELRGVIEIDGDVLRVKTGKSHVVLARDGVHVRAFDLSPRRTKNGIVVLRSGQVFVGELLQRPKDVVIDGLAFPRERVRWVEAGTETLSDAYWAKFPRGELDARYARERSDAAADADDEQASAGTPQRDQEPPRVVKDPFETDANREEPSLSEPALTFTDDETPAQRIKRLVDRASLKQLSLDWPAAAQAWRDAYLASGKSSHKANLETCLVRWIAETPALGDSYSHRVELLHEVVEPVKLDVRATLAACYLTTYESIRPQFHMEGKEEHLETIGRIHDHIRELGEFIDPNLREGIEDLEAFLEAFANPEARPEGFDFEGGGDHDGHDH